MKTSENLLNFALPLRQAAQKLPSAEIILVRPNVHCDICVYGNSA